MKWAPAPRNDLSRAISADCRLSTCDIADFFIGSTSRNDPPLDVPWLASYSAACLRWRKLISVRESNNCVCRASGGTSGGTADGTRDGTSDGTSERTKGGTSNGTIDWTKLRTREGNEEGTCETYSDRTNSRKYGPHSRGQLVSYMLYAGKLFASWFWMPFSLILMNHRHWYCKKL